LRINRIARQLFLRCSVPFYIKHNYFLLIAQYLFTKSSPAFYNKFASFLQFAQSLLPKYSITFVQICKFSALFAIA
jgi:hypothetical protein